MQTIRIIVVRFGLSLSNGMKNPLHAVRLFASFFVLFYFFHAGLEVPGSALVLKALLYGVALSLAAIPIRIVKNWIGCRFFSGRSSRSGFRVAITLIPTLVFTLVIAGILHETFHIDDALFGGLIVYAAITTILPSFVLPVLVTDSIEVSEPVHSSPSVD